MTEFMATPAWADKRSSSSPIVNEEKEAEIAVKVKKHLYPGGKDESVLKVQSTLNKPTRKISPTVEDKSEAESDLD